MNPQLAEEQEYLHAARKTLTGLLDLARHQVATGEILEAEAQGSHRLYVALTRAVSRLDLVHCRALPQALS